ncbi:hypothetical protein WJX77_009630 [Trebouxia sp. C0004]
MAACLRTTGLRTTGLEFTCKDVSNDHNMWNIPVVSEEDDEILATEYISSREALTLVWPIRRVGRKWGCLIPSPFDDSCTSRDLDEKEAELKSLEEAASAVGSELDPSAEKKGKASRKVLEHALTRAALEPDLAAIDKAEEPLRLLAKLGNMDELVAPEEGFPSIWKRKGRCQAMPCPQTAPVAVAGRLCAIGPEKGPCPQELFNAAQV